jgi:hypothetical protein
MTALIKPEIIKLWLLIQQPRQIDIRRFNLSSSAFCQRGLLSRLNPRITQRFA